MALENKSTQTVQPLSSAIANNLSSLGKSMPAVQLLSDTHDDKQKEDKTEARKLARHGIKSSTIRDIQPFQLKKDNTRLPNQPKSGAETLSRFTMDHIKVYSNIPAQLQVHTFAQGNDIAKSGLLPCGHESVGVVQRMISKEPDKTEDIEELEKYVFGTPINAKGQTFAHAVQGSEKGEMAFGVLLRALDEGNVTSAFQTIQRIIETVNAYEAREPNHPNQVWKGSNAEKSAKEHDSPYSIAKTPESIDMADKARKVILQKKIIGLEKFMLGVLVLPDKKLIVALSGSRTNLLIPIADALLEANLPLLNNLVYDVRYIKPDDDTTYRDAARQESKKYPHFTEEKDGRIVRERLFEDKEDIGSYLANCAAAVALSVAKSVHPTSFQGGGLMGLTEVFVSQNEHSNVMIYNKHTGEGDRFSMNSKDVPSCHVCQMQLEQVAKDVVALERNGILASLEMGIAKNKNKIVEMEEGLESLKNIRSQEESKASGKNELAGLLKEAEAAREGIASQLQQANKAFAKYSNEMEDIGRKIEATEKLISELTTKSKDLKWEIDNKARSIDMVERLEKEIEKLQKKVAILESDEQELTSLASYWNMTSWYLGNGWSSKVALLQKTNDFKDVSNKDIKSELSKKIISEKASLEAKQKEAANYSSSAELKEAKDKLVKERRKVNIEKSTQEIERGKLGKNKDLLLPELETLEADVNSKEAALNKSIDIAKDLQMQFNEASEADQKLKKLRPVIKKNETELNQLKRELKRLEMTFSVYSQQ